MLCCVLASIRWCSCCGCGRKVLGWQTAPAPPESSIPPQMQVMTPQQQMQMQSPYPAQPQPYPQQQAYGGQGGAYPPQASYAPQPQYGGGQYGGQAPAGYPPVAQLAVPQGYNGPQPGLGQYFPQQPYAVPAKSL